MRNNTAVHSAKTQFFTRILLVGLFILPLAGHCAATVVLQNCFSGMTTYMSTVDAELPSEDNKNGHAIETGTLLAGDGPIATAHCDCPKNLSASTNIYEMTAAGSPLQAGTNGYAYLTENLDIDVSGYADAINSPTGDNLNELMIDTYPTPMGSLPKYNELSKLSIGTNNVCGENFNPAGVTDQTPKHQFKWNMSRFKLYVKKSILGEEIIPSTVIVQNYSCLSTNNYCTRTADSTLVSEIFLSGRITAPLTCTINAGSTIEVELGNIVTSQFVTQGQPPASYTLKDVDISYHCDDPAAGNARKIKFSLSADQGVVPGSNNLIASMIGRDDVGVRMYDQDNNNVVLDGSLDLPVTLDEQGNGSIMMTAAPVSTTSKRPVAGKFEGNVTVKMELR